MQSGAVIQPSDMLNTDSLVNRKGTVLFHNFDVNTRSELEVNTWFVGIVMNVTDTKEEVKTKVEWDGEFDNEKDKIVYGQLLSRDV